MPGAGSALGRAYEARGISVLDADDDGLLDVVMATTRGAPAFLANMVAPRGHWLRVVLDGAPPNSGGVGARVEIDDGGRTHVRVRLAGEGYLGSFDPRLSAGVASETVHLLVRWPDGTSSELDTGADREITLTEPR